jgi:sensor domain CHASE-containing protein
MELMDFNPNTGVMLAVIPAAIALVVLVVMGVMKKMKNK